jgi:hypothetical protein
MRAPSILIFGLVLFSSNAVFAKTEAHPHSFAPDLEAFHEKLSPLWHAPVGPDRLVNACKESKTLRDGARAIKSKSNKSLIKSIKDFSKQCKKDSSTAADAFSKVHDEYHHLIEH